MQNEYRSELAVAALHASIRHQALVWRDGRQQRLDVADLVPGDVVALRVGDVVPADLRLLEANQLECDEAVLTGEPVPAVKTTAPAPTGDSTLDLPACAFMGTVVHQGAGRGVVVATGAQTAFGKIAVGLSQRQAETAFQAGLRGFSKLLVAVAQGAIGFDQALDPAGQPAGWPLLLGLVCNEATVGEHGPVGGNALDVALWSAPAAQPLTADPAGGPVPTNARGWSPSTTTVSSPRWLSAPQPPPRCWSPRAPPRPSSPAAWTSLPTPRRPWRGYSPTAPASSPSPPATRPG
jgi:hypothetical protein